MKKVILVTGASSGLGLATANALSANGHRVYGTSRDISRLKGVSFSPLEMDVTDDASVRTAVETMPATESPGLCMRCPLNLQRNNLK